MKFTYSSGQRPLDGYTIKRGIGLGGFGEVYYAVSDGGKEVALKLVRSNLEIELRGMSQCLNLKHPNLVSLYDLRNDAKGDFWVVMEYIAGEPLSSILARYPQGVGTELARQWLLGLGAAIGYLHDHGIVHRDLKPGNIFIENGIVKVGDYGLCKFIGGTQAAAQTQSVGTVHYMAPEISTGNYNRQIDIYAAGILLYEMLSGHVPFDGESAGEILMKHLTTLPDLSRVPVAFIPVLDQALAKNPARRYRTMAEMCRDVSRIGAPAEPEVREAGPTAVPVCRLSPAPPTVIEPPLTVRRRLGDLCASLLVAAALSGLLALLAGALTRTTDWTGFARIFFLTLACSWAVLIPCKWWTSPVDDSWQRRLLLLGVGLFIGLGALWLDGYSLLSTEEAMMPPGEERTTLLDGLTFDNRSLPALASYVSYFGLVFFVLRWWKIAEPRRSERFHLPAVLVTAFWAYILIFLLPGGSELRGSTWHTFFVALVAASAIIQLASPWQRPTPVRAKRLRLRSA
jgi:hypothetical protein